MLLARKCSASGDPLYHNPTGVNACIIGRYASAPGGLHPSEYLSAGILRDCGVTISELREHFAARLHDFYDAQAVAEIMDLAARKLALKLSDTILNELGRFEGTGTYEYALDHLLDAANLQGQYMIPYGQTVPHVVLTATLRNPLLGNLDKLARAEYRRTR